MNPLSSAAAAHLRDVLTRPQPPGDRYTVHELVGEGGMGAVYRATDRTLGRDVALKVLRPELADETSAARLRREAAILARLEHPGVVPVHEVGSLADGRVFYVMKLVRGKRLDEAVRGAPLAARLRLFLRICETVSFAHAHGVVHRDLKPSNVMVGAFGEVLVLDWGIARVLTERAEADGSRQRTEAVVQRSSDADTRDGTVLGTPGFMSPEQARGETASVGERSDVYALGAVLRWLAAEAVPDGRVPPPVQSVWKKASAALPEARYASAEALAADIARFLDAEPVSAHREGWVERAGRLYQRYQTAILLVLAYLAMRLIFLVSRGL
jgi:serine/threonine protein kinase